MTNAVEKEVELKETAAEIARKELEAVQTEAAITGDVQARQKAERLQREAVQLRQEAEALKGKLEVVQSKAVLAQKSVAANEAAVEILRQELEDLRRAKTAKRGWAQKGISVAVIILIGLLFFCLLEFLIKLFERAITQKDVIRESAAVLRFKTLSKLFHWLGVMVIFAMILYSVLQNVGVDVRPLLAGLGIVGLAFGFGGQYLIRDLINGIFIIVEGQYRINDVVKIGEYGGLVEDINLRITTLRDLAGRVIIIPNGEIKTVVNFTKYYSQALLNIGVAYKENVDRVMDVLRDLGREMKEDDYFGKLILADLEMLGVDDFADSQVTIKFRIKTLPIKQWEVSREMRRRIKNRFDELGIEIPFPHRTIYWGTDKDNEWMKEFAKQRPISANPGIK